MADRRNSRFYEMQGGSRDEKSRKKRWFLVTLSGIADLTLQILLVWTERKAPDATITSLGDAVWFSLVTLTTAGYGGLFSCHPWGKAHRRGVFALQFGLYRLLYRDGSFRGGRKAAAMAAPGSIGRKSPFRKGKADWMPLQKSRGKGGTAVP